ncbi:FadR/GntR family transcriptional regulator [Castellaniella sp. FW104-16D08]|uniref:FadR/GntR family transcriptional regulator n=1 Tax=unclassified Castellaniella TaxID=2617606 RepID=UPI003315F2A5
MARNNSPSTVIVETLSYIRTHRLESGDRLPSERLLAEKFGVGRGAVREALMMLECMRVVERRPNSGIYLRDLGADSSIEATVLQSSLGLPLSREEVKNAMEVRRILEINTVRIACERRSEEDLQHIRSILQESDARIKRKAPIDEQDRDFHLAIVAATKNTVLVRVVNSFYFLSQSRRKIYFSNIQRCVRSNEQHKAIFEAIEAQSAERAVLLMQNHLGSVENDWQSALSDTDKPAEGPEATASLA